jgi:hypothetical protein
MDFETTLRNHLRESADPRSIDIWLNDEARVVITVNDDDTKAEFVVVENTMIPWPVKPPAQRVATEGFDTHKGMGDHTK